MAQSSNTAGQHLLWIGVLAYDRNSVVPPFPFLAEALEDPKKGRPKNIAAVLRRKTRWVQTRDQRCWTTFTKRWYSQRWYVYVDENLITTIVITTLSYPPQYAVECLECVAARFRETQSALKRMGDGEDARNKVRDHQAWEVRNACRLYNNIEVLKCYDEARILREQLVRNMKDVFDAIGREEKILSKKIKELKESAQVFKKRSRKLTRKMWIDEIFMKTRTPIAGSSGAAAGSSAYATSHNPIVAVFAGLTGAISWVWYGPDVLRSADYAYTSVVDFFEAKYEPTDEVDSEEVDDEEVDNDEV